MLPHYWWVLIGLGVIVFGPIFVMYLAKFAAFGWFRGKKAAQLERTDGNEGKT